MERANFTDFSNRIEKELQDLLETCVKVTGDQINLDKRVGSVWLAEDAIIVNSANRNAINYYGGFEYIDPEYVQTIGDYTIYSSNEDRVRGCLDYFNGVDEEYEKEDE